MIINDWDKISWDERAKIIEEYRNKKIAIVDETTLILPRKNQEKISKFILYVGSVCTLLFLGFKAWLLFFVLYGIMFFYLGNKGIYLDKSTIGAKIVCPICNDEYDYLIDKKNYEEIISNEKFVGKCTNCEFDREIVYTSVAVEILKKHEKNIT